jgi:hypothetical protein
MVTQEPVPASDDEVRLSSRDRAFLDRSTRRIAKMDQSKVKEIDDKSGMKSNQDRQGRRWNLYSLISSLFKIRVSLNDNRYLIKNKKSF